MVEKKAGKMVPRHFPQWIRTRLGSADSLGRIRGETYAKGLHTVCREALCPNQGECARKGTATFMILGDRCTRNCAFCAVEHGEPVPIQGGEPEQVAQAVKSLGLAHAVITSITRDDLADGGASVFAETVRAVLNLSLHTSVEVLIPDFQGCPVALGKVINSAPDVINHNLETVPRLYAELRHGASYQRSLTLLRRVADHGPEIVTKSGIMVGLGETREELLNLFADLGEIGCQVLTIGQYLQPTLSHHAIVRFVPPEEFEELAQLAQAAGVKKVAAGPLVRSSYRAGEVLQELRAMNSFATAL